MRISSPIKGLITAVLMIAVFLLVYQADKNSSSYFQYFVYGIYGAGIIWVLLGYRKSDSFTGKFADSFQQGFKCFIVVTLCMALFYWIFNYIHPEFKEEMALKLKEQLISSKDKMPSDIERDVAAFKKQYTISLVSRAIFGYLIIGALVTSVGALLLNLKKK